MKLEMTVSAEFRHRVMLRMPWMVVTRWITGIMRTILCKLSVSCRSHGYLEWQDLWGIMPFPTCVCGTGFTELTAVSDR